MTDAKRIYLDNNATTGLDPRVREAMLAELSELPANPSSAHYFGREARSRVSKARENIGSFLQVKPQELIFTSGGTEAMNLLMRGFFSGTYRGHIISSDIEHSCVANTLQVLQQWGVQVTYLPAGLFGAVKPEAVQAALRPDTRFIVLAAVNSETGVKTDIEAIAAIAKAANVPFIVDSVAWLGKELFTIPAGVSGMGFSGHKLHGPKGIGLAFLRSSLKLQPQLTGGDQEYTRRSGTENLAGILGLEKAIELLKQELPSATSRMEALRDHFEKSLREQLGNIQINGSGPRICNTANIAFPNIDGETLLIALDQAGIAASHGSACSSGALEPSRVLMNMGVAKKISRSSVRFSLSRTTTREEIDAAIEIIAAVVKRLDQISRAMS